MVIVGLNYKYAKLSQNKRKSVKDGAVCIIGNNGELLLATAEERISRKKHDGGYESVLKMAQSEFDELLQKRPLVVGSRCCEPLTEGEMMVAAEKILDVRPILIPSHHLSHAYSVFFASQFNEALIVVVDAGGSLLKESPDGEWWKVGREQSSYYIGSGKNIRLVGRDFDGPSEAGLGEVYRAFTYYLGWPSYTFSANTMALAAYGNPERFKNATLFSFNNGRLHSLVVNSPHDPIRMIRDWAEHVGIGKLLPPPRNPKDNLVGHQFEKDYCDLAAFVQRETERALINKITYLAQKWKIANLCIAGGVGLNCVANRKILDNTPISDIFIVPAAGDDGQALGNAYYGYYSLLNQQRTIKPFSPYLGFDYTVSFDDVINFFETKNSDVLIGVTTNAPQIAASLIFAGQIIGWYQGRSEYGPRALGNRSILSDPRSLDISERLRKSKEREYFRPFAPSILEEDVDSFFDIPISSPYMLLVAYGKQSARELTPAVIHVDGSSRIQTVSRDDNALYYELISHFKKLSGIPMVLNTSFNRKGEPIVETPEDAFYTFLGMDMDTLVLKNFVIQKVKNKDFVCDSLSPKFLKIDLTKTTPTKLKEVLKRCFSVSLSKREYMHLFDEYVEWVYQGKKTTTIRFTRGGIDWPQSFTLPLFSTDRQNRQKIRQAGCVILTSMKIKPFGQLNVMDAYNDGFSSLSELKSALHFIYGNIDTHEYITIYTIKMSMKLDC